MVDYVCNGLPKYLSRPLKPIQSVNRSRRSRNWSTPTPVHIPGASTVLLLLCGELSSLKMCIDP